MTFALNNEGVVCLWSQGKNSSSILKCQTVGELHEIGKEAFQESCL